VRKKNIPLYVSAEMREALSAAATKRKIHVRNDLIVQILAEWLAKNENLQGQLAELPVSGC
jgi:hypothetical protein